jgi:hypothetical protein
MKRGEEFNQHIGDVYVKITRYIDITVEAEARKLLIGKV